LALGEVERGLYASFIFDLVNERGIPFFKAYLKCLKALATFLGIQFMEWMDKKSKSTADEVFQFAFTLYN
jgi:hypothetical protein